MEIESCSWFDFASTRSYGAEKRWSPFGDYKELLEKVEKVIKKENELEELGELLEKVKMEINLLCQSKNK